MEALLAVAPAKRMTFLFKQYAHLIAEQGHTMDIRSNTCSGRAAYSSSSTKAIAQGDVFSAPEIFDSSSALGEDEPKNKRARRSLDEPDAQHSEIEIEDENTYPDDMAAVEYELALELDRMLSSGAAESENAD